MKKDFQDRCIDALTGAFALMGVAMAVGVAAVILKEIVELFK